VQYGPTGVLGSMEGHCIKVSVDVLPSLIANTYRSMLIGRLLKMHHSLS
jgi:hypothetical protein